MFDKISDKIVFVWYFLNVVLYVLQVVLVCVEKQSYVHFEEFVVERSFFLDEIVERSEVDMDASELLDSLSTFDFIRLEVRHNDVCRVLVNLVRKGCVWVKGHQFSDDVIDVEWLQDMIGRSIRRFFPSPVSERVVCVYIKGLSTHGTLCILLDTYLYFVEWSVRGEYVKIYRS